MVASCVQGTTREIKRNGDLKKMTAVVLGGLTAKSNGTGELKPKLQVIFFEGKTWFISQKHNVNERMWP